MIIKIKRVYISNVIPEESNAEIEVEGIGGITLKAQLPSEIQEQVENFYDGLLRERLSVQVIGTL